MRMERSEAKAKDLKRNLNFCKNILLFWILGCFSSGISFAASPVDKDEKAPSYYSIYGDTVKLLPLKDKGLSQGEVKGKKDKLFGRVVPEPVFITEPKPAGKDNVEYETVAVELLEDAGIDRNAFVRFGFPLPEGALFDAKHIKILSPENKPVDAQIAVTAFWKDKSIKWVLIQFNTPLKANQKSIYQVAFGSKVSSNNNASPLKMEENSNIIKVVTGPLQAVIDKKSFNLLKDVHVDRNRDGVFGIDERVGCFDAAGLQLTDEKLDIFTSSAMPPDKISVEEQGPEKLVLKIEGKYSQENTKREFMYYVVRLGFQKNSSIVNASITHTNTFLEHEFSDISSFNITFIPDSTVNKLDAGLAAQKNTPISSMIGSGKVRIFQENDCELSISPGERREKEKLSGTFGISAGKSSFAVNIKNCWQRWPKALTANQNSVVIELLPEQPGKTFGKNLPHYLQFPLCEGMYRMKWGMAFTEDIAFDFSGAKSFAELNAENNMPVVPVLPRDWYFRTKTLPGATAGTDKQFSAWDDFVSSLFNDHMKLKAEQREYGIFNYGDWYGERGRNWGNNEYDLAHGLFMAFIRTGRRDYYRWAMLAAEHQADVDCIHAYPDEYYIGANHQHSVGHTGEWSQRPIRATWTYAYSSHTSADNGHTWTRGMIDAWYLGGNPRALQSAFNLGEHIVWAMSPSFKTLSSFERTAGWSLNAICALYNLNYDPLYMETATHIADVAMKEQKFDQGGAWPHLLPYGHDGGNKNTCGNSCFMVGVLLEGLENYYEISKRPEVAKSILAASQWLASAWNNDDMGWPLTAATTGASYWSVRASSSNMLMAPSLGYAANISGEKKFYEIASRAFESTVFIGSHFHGRYIGLLMCLSPELISELIKWQEAHPDSRKDLLTGDFMPLLKMVQTQKLNIRGSVKRNFLLKLKASNPEIEINRSTVKIADTKGCIVIKNADNKICEQAELEGKGAFSRKFRLEGNTGDVFRIVIDDNTTGIWNLNSGDIDIFAETGDGLKIGGIGIARYFITIPASVNEFSLELSGIFEGVYGGMVIDENDNVIGATRAMNKGYNALLPMKKAKHPVTELKIKVKESKYDRVWTLYLWANNDISVKMKNLPPYLSLQKTLCPILKENSSNN